MKGSTFAELTRIVALIAVIGSALPAASETTQGEATAADRGPLAYITRFDGGGISVIDTATDQEITVLPAQSPEGVAMAPGGRPVYVADYGAGRLLIIDDSDGTPKIVSTVEGLTHARAVLATPDGTRVFVGSHEGVLTEIDARTRTVKQSYNLGFPRSIFGLAVTNDSRRLVVTTADSSFGSVSLFDAQFINVGPLRTQTIATEIYSVAITLDQRYAVLPGFRGSAIYFYDLVTPGLFGPRNVGYGTFGVAIHPTTGRVYATTLDDHVVAFDPTPFFGAASPPIRVGSHPQGLSFTPDGSRLYVANQFSNSVSVIHVPTSTVVKTLAVPGGPVSLGQFIAPTGRSVEITEFYNVNLNHYFRTANPAEAIGIDNGAAGPGWVRTNLPFRAWATSLDAPLNAVPVCRFYGTPGRGPNSHFYTSSASECTAVKRDPGWTYEGIAFYAVPTFTDNTCPTNLTSVWRTYNNDFAHNNSNHRMGVELATYSAMVAQGWLGEGIVMCAE